MRMSKTYTLSSPFIEFEWTGKPDHWQAIVVSWYMLWTTVIVGILYLVAVVLPDVWSTETVVLGLLTLLMLGQGDA